MPETHDRNRPLCVVVHDRGSATPVGILSAARQWCDVVFLFARHERAPRIDERIPDGVARVDIGGLGEDEVCALVADMAPNGVLTFSEWRLGLTARIAAHCGLPYHSTETVRLLTDKFAQRAALDAAGVPSARVRVVRTVAEVVDAAARVGLPAVLKPRNGAGSVDTCRMSTVDECDAVMAEFLADPRAPRGDFVLEELLVGDPAAAGPDWGDYVSAESVVSGDEVTTVCLTGKFPLAEPFRETGMVLPATLDETLHEASVRVAEAAVRALGIRHGVTHTELKLTQDGPRVIEVNGRMGGYVSDLLRRATGFDLPRAALAAAVGEPVVVPELRWRRLEIEYFLTPPVGASKLVSWNAPLRARDTPGVRSLELRAEPGAVVDWRLGTEGHLGVVSGSAANHDAVLAAVDDVRRRLDIIFA